MFKTKCPIERASFMVRGALESPYRKTLLIPGYLPSLMVYSSLWWTTGISLSTTSVKVRSNIQEKYIAIFVYACERILKLSG